jgi:hypothetical protein
MKKGWGNTKGRLTMEPSGNEEERKTKEELEKIGYQRSGKSWNEVSFLAADRQKRKELVDNLRS